MLKMLGKSVGLGSARPWTEVRAGLTTYITMAYILVVNPAILATAIQVDDAPAQLLTATALTAALGCLCMGFIARAPYAIAPGMGINAYFAYTVVGVQGIPWQAALGAVFLSGIFFVALSLSGLRSAIVAIIPQSLKHATTAGIGAFLLFIGCENAGLVVDHSSTLVTLGDFHGTGLLLATLGLIVTGVCMVRKVPGAVLIGIAVVTLVAITTGAPVYAGHAFGGFEQGIVRMPHWPNDIAFALDLTQTFNLGLFSIVFVFFFVDFFDTAGTLIGLTHVSQQEGAADERHLGRAFTCDAIATSAGALLGTSTATSYIESAAGIEEGGRTGLTAVTVGLLFAASTVLWPLAGVVPAQATAPVLILLGCAMMSGLKNIDWGRLDASIPAALTVFLMPLTFSIANGISIGILMHVLLKALTGSHREIHPGLAILALLLILRFAFLAIG